MFDTKNKGYVTADEAYPILYHELGESLKLMRDVKQIPNLAVHYKFCICTNIMMQY